MVTSISLVSTNRSVFPLPTQQSLAECGSHATQPEAGNEDDVALLLLIFSPSPSKPTINAAFCC